MGEDSQFKALIREARAGNETAAAELVRRYEPAIRRAIRIRLLDPALERYLDSMDICQSVMASFFVRMNLGQFELESPRQLLKLLEVMARNKLNDHVRRQRAGRRDHRLVEAEPFLANLSGADATPSRVMAGKELLQQAQRLLSADEWHLAVERAAGRSWDDLAQEMGKSPDALRKQLERATERVAEELGIDRSE